MRPTDDELTDLWYDTMGDSGNPLGTLERTRIAGGVIVEIHSDVAVSGLTRVDCFEFASHDADIPRDAPDRFTADDDAVTGWNRIGTQKFQTRGAASEWVDDRSNAMIRERMLLETEADPC